jgi:copper chaperone
MIAMLKLKVAGMTCGGCAASIRKAVERASPGAKVAVDIATGEVAIEGTLDRTRAVSAIEEAGYDVVGDAA